MYGADGRQHSYTCRAKRRRWIDDGQPGPLEAMARPAAEVEDAELAEAEPVIGGKRGPVDEEGRR
eukprot:7491205-Heterocapsa_arctica.AAC.1